MSSPNFTQSEISASSDVRSVPIEVVDDIPSTKGEKRRTTQACWLPTVSAIMARCLFPFPLLIRIQILRACTKMLSATIPSLQDGDTSRPVASHVRYREVPGPTLRVQSELRGYPALSPQRRLGSNPNATCICFELTGQLTPIHSPTLVTWSGAFRARLRSSQVAPCPRRPCRGPGATPAVAPGRVPRLEVTVHPV